ncbi:MAG: hypothetical protein K2M17_03705 [Bacilli bacterium]|nr:hypothetical protein [Bacilli bacterium]
MRNIQPVCIHKDTPNIRMRLGWMGYKELPTGRYYERTPKCLTPKPDEEFLCCVRGFYDIFPIGNKALLHNIIDCGTNEDLFLALVALNNKNDFQQWFVYRNKNGERWFKCPENDIEEYREDTRRSGYNGAYIFESHKASIKEIIEHFKIEEKIPWYAVS